MPRIFKKLRKSKSAPSGMTFRGRTHQTWLVACFSYIVQFILDGITTKPLQMPSVSIWKRDVVCVGVQEQPWATDDLSWLLAKFSPRLRLSATPFATLGLPWMTSSKFWHVWQSFMPLIDSKQPLSGNPFSFSIVEHPTWKATSISFHHARRAAALRHPRQCDEQRGQLRYFFAAPPIMVCNEFYIFPLLHLIYHNEIWLRVDFWERYHLHGAVVKSPQSIVGVKSNLRAQHVWIKGFLRK